MLQVIDCPNCKLVSRHDYSAQNKCPVCYSSNSEAVTEEVEESILINVLLKHIQQNESQETIDSLLKAAEIETDEKY